MFYFKQQHERDMNPVSYCKQFHYKKKEIMSASGAFHSSIPTLVLHWQHFNKTNKEKLTFGQHCTNKDTRKENVFNIQECFDFKMRSTHQKCNIKMISINNNKHDLKKKKNQINSYGNYSENKETEHVHQSFWQTHLMLCHLKGAEKVKLAQSKSLRWSVAANQGRVLVTLCRYNILWMYKTNARKRQRK